MSTYQKRKMKINQQVSLGNISITDERSTDIMDDNTSLIRYHNQGALGQSSIRNNQVRDSGIDSVSSNTQSLTPYKTLNNFKNLKNTNKQTLKKQSSQLRNPSLFHNTNTHHNNSTDS